MEVEVDHAHVGAARGLAACCRAAFADARRSERYSRISSSRCCALLVGELEEDPLAFGVLEALAVALEEPVRAALAADADQQRLQVVDAAASAARRLRRTGRSPRP